MNKFKLPIIKDKRFQKQHLSMDEYVELNQSIWENMTDKDKKTYQEWTKKRAVNVPFKIDE